MSPWGVWNIISVLLVTIAIVHMNKLYKVLTVASVIGSALIAAPAFAATVSSQAVFDGGQTKVYGNAGQSVQLSVQVHVNSGEVLNAIRTKVDSQATVCTPVGPYEGDQTVTVNPTIILPPNSNSSGYNLTADLFTTDTLPQAQAMTDPNLACSSAGPGAHIFANAYNGSGVVNVLPGTGGSSVGSTVTGSVFGFTSFADFVAAMKTALGIGSTSTPTPTPSSAICSMFAQANAGTMPNVYSPANSALQGFLISQHMSIPALTAGASWGFYGNQTTTAVGIFNSINHCI